MKFEIVWFVVNVVEDQGREKSKVTQRQVDMSNQTHFHSRF